MLSGRKVLLGVTGSIAAYKAAYLVRLLVKQGAEVRVVMTPSASDFVSPLTFATLSKNEVGVELKKENQSWTNHVEWGLWADVFLIAPASANTLAKMANGICDNFFLATYLSVRCPVLVSPAMDDDMWKHAATQKNISTLESFGHKIIQPAFGELASGLTGEGRMAEPEELVAALEKFFAQKKTLAGTKALVSAGPTHEYIDAVRYISNASSGKMGFAIAEELANRGAEVVLVSGPTSQILKNKNIEFISVVSAGEMREVCMKKFPAVQLAVMAAAVADFTPQNFSSTKIKKEKMEAEIKLQPTADILRELGGMKKKNQVLVGFALETDNEIANAKKKLESKNCDLIVLNSLNDAGAGFGFDTNKISVIDPNGNSRNFDLQSKSKIASDLADCIEPLLHA